MAASVAEIAIGAARTPLFIIDDVFADPAAAREAALRPAAALDHPGDFYPGARHPLPEEFHQAFADWLSRLVSRPFASERNGYVSVVTRPAAELLPIQTLPHFDTTDEAAFAAVIYLFETGHGGTSFYRHRSTGYEVLDRRTEPLYRAALRREVADPAALPRRYRNGGDALFERIHSQAPRFNRMILYPARILHAGDIEPDFPGGTGRLTITALCRTKPS
jgi:hypothetical protein